MKEEWVAAVRSDGRIGCIVPFEIRLREEEPVSTTTVALDEKVYERLLVLSGRVGQSPEAIFGQALTDYERKLESESRSQIVPRTEAEAELFDDPGRIRIAPRGQQAILAHVVSAARRPCRVSSEED